MVDWEEETIAGESKQIHYYFSRSGIRPAFIFLHGAMDNGLCYERLAEQFQDDYDLYLPDARGHGQSSDFPKTADFHLMVDDIKDLCEKNDLRGVTLMGHSMGGVQAAQFAVTYPELVKALILEDPGFLSRRMRMQFTFFKILMSLAVRHQDNPKPLSEFEKKSKKWNPKWDPRDQLTWAKAQQEFAAHYPKQLFAVLMKGMPEGSEIIPQIQAPILLITSKSGLITEKRAKQFQAIQPGLQWKYIAQAGHNIRREQFQELVNAIKEFLALLK
ncbi:MAG TPA: alpha/beta hydrolase [Candidatus Lokiarchaeia archaeon]|nr:alpha/beta hydrolase [Candidatus Lokiarchaeia archaeon]